MVRPSGRTAALISVGSSAPRARCERSSRSARPAYHSESTADATADLLSAGALDHRRALRADLPGYAPTVRAQTGRPGDRVDRLTEGPPCGRPPASARGPFTGASARLRRTAVAGHPARDRLVAAF